MPFATKVENPLTSKVFERVTTPVRSEVQHDLVLAEVRALRREVEALRALLSPYPGRLLIGPEVVRYYQRLKG